MGSLVHKWVGGGGSQPEIDQAGWWFICPCFQQSEFFDEAVTPSFRDVILHPSLADKDSAVTMQLG